MCSEGEALGHRGGADPREEYPLAWPERRLPLFLVSAREGD